MGKYILIAIALALQGFWGLSAMGAEMGKYNQEQFMGPQACSGCHREIYQEWKDSLMAQSFTHAWDQVEYFELALPHSKQLEKVSGIKAGCIGCHSPIAFLTGDIPPKRAEKGTRANEGVSCDICHHITGSHAKEPYNFSYEIKPGPTKYGNRKDARSPAHKTAFSEFMQTPQFCATCHDEQSPYGAWVKSTYREWKAGPYAKEGTRCQDCHIYYADGKSAIIGKKRKGVAHHVFQGSHSKTKLKGAIDLAIYPNKTEVKAGSKFSLRAVLFNGKAGHKIPSGSTEERMLWLEVWAFDKNGKAYPLRVEKKGFKGEEYTIADPDALAYQAIGEIKKIKDFKGLSRDGDIPSGARIFRKPFFDPKGRMTICQWYTEKNDLVDYRIGPRETKIEKYTWTIPEDVPEGDVIIKANLLYSQVPSSIGKFFSLPESEYSPILVNTATTTIQVEK